MTFNPKYKIGQKVWHITKESDEGVILDILYYVHSKQIQYIVALDFKDQVTCVERELSESKVF